MKVKKEPVDREYDEEGQPPDDALPDPLTVKPEALESFEGTSFRIKYEFQTDIKQYSSKEDVTLEDSENGEQSTPFGSALNNQIQVNQELELPYSNNTSPILFDDIEIDEINVKREVLGHQPIEVVINLEKRVFFERNFVCSICMQVFASIDSLSLHRHDHQKDILGEGSTRITTKCDQRKYKSSTPVNCNLLCIEKKPFESDICVYKSAYSFNLKSHQLSHSGEKPFGCDLCVYKSAYKSQLKTHRLLHTGEKPFKCVLCDYKSAYKSNIKIHHILHTGDKPFKCALCVCKFTQKSSLKIHQLSHTGEKPFECDLCGFKSARKSSLKTHRLLHSASLAFECDLCDYKSARKSSLKDHVISHTSEKTFECDICIYKSAHKSSLKAHRLSHSAVKPFECALCDFKSAVKSSLKKHVISHTDEKAFTCDQCDHKFSWKSNLNRHKKTHTSKKNIQK